uniref:FTP domain-containing protein n=1 Tax=Macrostomum lignano TaxID=282301 RepID=A0A1I8GSE3_9PLAT
AEVISPGVQFTAARTGSAVAPPEFLARIEDSEIGCGIACSHRSDCFGFYWLLGACRLFDLHAFFNLDAWVSIGTCDVFLREKLPISTCQESSSKVPCSRAIDGVANQYYHNLSCSHTNLNLNEWWEASLTTPSLVSFVTIYNRLDCCGHRLNKFDILVDGSVCNQVRLSAPFSVSNFSCNAYGSKIRILSRSNPAEPVTICEFMAYKIQG